MISQFWNLCRACPALDVDKLHSEYRSTYRWHEYTPKSQQSTVVRTAPTPQPLTSSDGSEFSRGRKKAPDVAYRCHDLFEARASSGHTDSDTRATRPQSRMSRERSHRRSRSEGPVHSRTHGSGEYQSEYRLQFAVSSKGGAGPHRSRRHEQPQEIRPASSGVAFPGSGSTAPVGWTSRHSSLKSRERSEARGETGVSTSQETPKKSISMGQIQGQQGATRDKQDVNGNTDTTDVGTKSPARVTKEYKSEYKQKYRPFSQYEYIGDGKFHNTSTSPPGDQVDNAGAGAGTMGHKIARSRQERQERTHHLSGEPWYQEVIELRKAANDYKCRGWGTDLVPPHLSQIYSQHVDEATKRESLSALALAITPRSLNKDEKEKENQRKSSSPMKARSRPRTAPPKSSKKTSRSESARSTPGLVPAKTETDGGIVKSGRPQSAAGGGTSPGPGAGGWKVHLAQDTPAPAKPQRPNSEAKDKIGSGVSRASSKAQSRDCSRPPSAIENNIDYFKEPVVKSPPEPTRVRSPEQLMMRSPDPINWTVPLDTGKTFQVTQCVRDSARNSPMSDHSSHFDSVLGTAINLGIHSVNEKGSLHYPKVSALAREAKELQGVRSPSSNSVKKDDDKGSMMKASPTPDLSAAGPVEASNDSDSSGYNTNTKLNGTQSQPAVNGLEKDKNDNKIQPLKPTDSTITCLEDPTFSFDEPKSSSVSSKSLPVDETAMFGDSAPSKAPVAPVAPAAVPSKVPASAPVPAVPTQVPAQPKRPSYRVLEDPDIMTPPPSHRPGSQIPDPMTTSIYEPKN